jgi:hypothetical protein
MGEAELVELDDAGGSVWIMVCWISASAWGIIATTMKSAGTPSIVTWVARKMRFFGAMNAEAPGDGCFFGGGPVSFFNN